jgi:hypothetical protein
MSHLVHGPSTRPGEAAHGERIFMSGYLDLDPNQARSRAMTPDPVRSHVVVSGNSHDLIPADEAFPETHDRMILPARGWQATSALKAMRLRC